jgi:hypothetical protein
MGMAPFSMLFVLLVLTIVMFGRAFKRFFDFREKQLQAQVGSTVEKAAQYAAQTERLEQRVRVLERIITDRGADLAGQIENLREQPLN